MLPIIQPMPAYFELKLPGQLAKAQTLVCFGQKSDTAGIFGRIRVHAPDKLWQQIDQNRKRIRLLDWRLENNELITAENFNQTKEQLNSDVEL